MGATAYQSANIRAPAPIPTLRCPPAACRASRRRHPRVPVARRRHAPAPRPPPPRSGAAVTLDTAPRCFRDQKPASRLRHRPCPHPHNGPSVDNSITISVEKRLVPYRLRRV